MARPEKEGLDYFPLDCCLNGKIKLIEAEFGLKGFAIIVKLYQKIYKERGYYCEWNEDAALLFLAELGGNSGADKNFIDMIVSASVRRGIFSKQLYEDYGILTSPRIQEEYFNAVSKRKNVGVKKEYLLVKVNINNINYDNNSINNGINPDNDSINPQSREEKSKDISCAPEPHGSEKNVKGKEEQLERDFEIIYALYPKKVGRTVAFAEYIQWVSEKGKTIGAKHYRLTNRQIYLAVKKYVRQQEDTGKDDFQYWKNFDTLMGRQLLDYVEWEGEKR